MKSHVTTVTTVCDQCGKTVTTNGHAGLPDGWRQAEFQIDYAWRKGGDFCSKACILAFIDAMLDTPEDPA